MTIGEAFNESVAYYDDWVEKALPCFDELFSVAVEVIPYPVLAELKVLDLGAGTGLFSSWVFNRYKRSQFTLVDVADKMLGISKKRFSPSGEQFSYITADYRSGIPDDSFDLIISSLSIHHLDDNEKQELFKNIFSHLKIGGVFINVDQIKGPSRHFQELYWNTWLSKVRESGAGEEQIQDSIARRTAFDQDATLADQVQWLYDAGFEKVDCVYHHYFIGVFYAEK